MPPPRPPVNSWPTRLVVPALVCAVACVYWPGLYGFWTRDDFMQLAYARLIGSPGPLFVHDHYFPAPGSIFRPLGFASMWLWQAFFGTNYFAHAFADMLLHIGVSLAMYRIVRLSGLDRVPAALCTLLFALHPAVIGTALWWSARFDLLAALFAFIAVRAAFDYQSQRRLSFLVVTLLATLAALLSKETAAALVAAIALVWLHWAWRDVAHRAVAVRALVALLATALVFVAWRWAVLGTAASGLAGETSLIALIGKGSVDWLGYFAGYLSFWTRLGGVQRVLVGATALALFGLSAVAIANRKRPASSNIDVLLCGLCLFLLPAVLQAPIVALNATPLRGDVSAVEAAMQSRLYYLSIGGFVIALSVLVQRLRQIVPAFTTTAILAIGVVALGWSSREAASAYAARSSAPRDLAEAIATAADRFAPPAGRCHLFFLGIDPPPEWSIYVSPDSIAKALSPNLQRIERCFVHTDYPTFFHLLGRDENPADATPYQPREIRGVPIPWLRVGDALVGYIEPPSSGATAANIEGAVFLRYENGTFNDVTADVVAGRLHVDLH